MASKKFDLSVILTLVDNFSNKMTKVGKSMKKVGSTLSMSVTAPIVAFGALTLKTAADFQGAMNMVGAVTNATSSEFESMRLIARKMGAETQYSATEAADAMKFMGMAGMKTDKIIGALPKVLQLAASAQLDMGAAADIVTNIMSGYGKDVKELGHVNDVLVNAFTGSNVNLQQLGDGMRKVGPVASKLGFRFEETAAALGLLGSAGIQGQEAGVGLRRIMTQLVNPTKQQAEAAKYLELNMKNSDGTIKDLTGMVKEFEGAMAKGATETQIAQAAMTMFGDRAGPHFLALLGAGSEELAKFEKNLNKAGTSARVSEAQMVGLPGALKLIKSQFEAVRLAISDSGFGKFMEDAIRGVAGAFESLSKTDPQILKWGTIVAGIFAAAGPLLVGLGMVATAIGAISLPVVAVVAAIAGIAAAGILIYKNWDGIKKFFTDIWEEGILKPIRMVEERWKQFKKMLGIDDSVSGPPTPAPAGGSGNMFGTGGGMALAGAAWGKSQNEITVLVKAADGTSASVSDTKGDGKVTAKSKVGSGLTYATMGWNR